MSKKKQEKESVESTEKYVDVSEMSFVKDNKIDTDALSIALNGISDDAIRANKGNKAAGRRFRLNTVEISKVFLELRNITPKAIKKNSNTSI